MTLRIALLGTDNTHGHQFAGFINGWSKDVPVPTESKHGFLPQFYLWAKALREAEHDPDVPVPSTDARITSIWCPDKDGAALVARACGIETNAASPQEAVDDADAVLVLTEDPRTHFDLAVLALERGLPTMVDKPLTQNVESNHRLAALAEVKNAPWMTGSAFRYSPSLQRFRQQLADTVGDCHAIYVAVAGPLPYYGVHALEIAHQLVPLSRVAHLQGFEANGRSGALLTLESSATAMIECLEVTAEPPGHAVVYGARGMSSWHSGDTYLAILAMANAFVTMATTGAAPVTPEENLLLADLALELTNAAATHD